MPWTPPSDPVTSTVITVAYAVANLLTQIRWLRLMTGNADPPGSSYTIVSDSASATRWAKVPSDAIAALAVTNPLLATDAVDDRVLAAGAAQANFAYTPVNRAGDSMSGGLAITSPGTALLARNVDTAPSAIGLAVSSASGAVTELLVRHVGVDIGVPLAVAANTTLSEVDVVGSTGGVSIRAVGDVTAAGVSVRARSSHTGTQAPSTISPQGLGSALDADTLRGQFPTATPAAGRIPLADAAGKLDGWVTPTAFSIPSGLGCWVRSAAEIPAGFARETALDGLLPIGAGASFDFPAASNILVAGTAYGNTWQHAHTDAGHSHGSASHTHGGSALGVAGSTAGPTGTGTGGGTGSTFADGSHTHGVGSLDVTGATDGTSLTTNSGSAVIGGVSWIPPMRAVVWARKT